MKSLEDLHWTEPIKKNNENANDDDNKQFYQQQQPQQSQPQQQQPDPEPPKQPIIIQPEPKQQPKPQPVEEKPVVNIVYTEWECPKCGAINEMAYKFCPKCGCNRDLWKPPHLRQPAQVQPVQPIQPKLEEPEAKKPANNKEEPAIGVINEQNKEEINEILLKKVSIINDGVYQPSEERQTGWIVKNITNKNVDINAKLIKIGGDDDVKLKFDEVISFQMKPNDEMFILIEVKAPSLPNQYHMFYQLVLVNDNKKRICDMLQLPVLVKKQFSDDKENKIKQIFQMGFSDRKKIITALKKWNWDELKAINWLATH